MSIGTALFVFGAWLAVVAALASSSVNSTGLRRAYVSAWCATAIGLALTAVQMLTVSP